MNNLNTKIIIATREDSFSGVEALLRKIIPDINVKRIGDSSGADVILASIGQAKEIISAAKDASDSACVIFNYEDSALSQAFLHSDFKKASYGFSPEADFSVSDENATDDGLNFKLNYKGSTVPIWIKKPFSKDEIYAALSFISAAATLGFNVVEISKVLKNF